MAWDASGIEELRTAVEDDPRDSFNRCNLACALAAEGWVDEALLQLAAAVGTARSQISAGCVASAMRDVADSLALAWSLPTLGPDLPLAAEQARRRIPTR